MKNSNLNKLVLAEMLLALGMVLPFVTGRLVRGIAVQLVLIPAIMVALGMARMISIGKSNEATESN